MRTAKLIKQLEGNWSGDARLYQLSEYIKFRTFLAKEEITLKTNYVIVSGTQPMFQDCPETYIFPADSNGNVLDWTELRGSFKGEIDHEKALQDAGYAIVQ